MTIIEALNTVRNICDAVRLNKQERTQVDLALQTIANALKPPPKEEKKDG